MSSPAALVAVFLDAQGVGDYPGNGQWCISIGAEATEPPDTLTLFDTGGLPPDTDDLDILLPTFQVRSRSISYEAGYAKHEEIRDLLILPRYGIPLGTDPRAEVTMTSDILAIGKDDNDRFLLTANYSIRLARGG